MKKLASLLMNLVLGFYLELHLSNHGGALAEIGINWGRLSSQRLIPSMVVDLFLQNGVRHVRVYNQLIKIAEPFSNSGITFSVGISNNNLYRLENETEARTWVQTRIAPYYHDDSSVKLDIKYVTIGTEPFSRSFVNKTYDSAVDALRNVQKYLNEYDFGRNIKASIPHYLDVLEMNKTSNPSDADFRPDIKERMVESIRILKENNSPFMIGMYPVHYVHKNEIDLEYAFIDNKSRYFVKDRATGHVYRNVFEYVFDSFHWAITKAGGGDLKIVVGTIGWPTDGFPGANIENAERFYREFLPYITSRKGTPMRPGAPIDVYLHSLSDENRNGIELGGFQRHWGIYKFDGEPKYKIDLSGQGRDIFPSKAKGVTRMPKRWCVFNGNYSDQRVVDFERWNACNNSDCSSLADGGTCSNLTESEKVSYSFNRYFQMQGQAANSSINSCHMQGLGMVVAEDPSTAACTFPIEILAAETADTGSVFGTKIMLESMIVNEPRNNGAGSLPHGRKLLGLPLLLCLAFSLVSHHLTK